VRKLEERLRIFAKLKQTRRQALAACGAVIMLTSMKAVTIANVAIQPLADLRLTRRLARNALEHLTIVERGA